MGRSYIPKTLVFSAVIAFTLLASTVAEAVTGQVEIYEDSAEIYVTTGIAYRARTEVQIRRLKNLIVSRQIEGDEGFEQLERLQDNLQGRK